MFPAMIQDWRLKWIQSEEFAFYFVQLAPYTENALQPGLADTRLNQQLALELSLTGMATTIDLGDVNSPYGNIHPQDKQTVGYRLSLIARQQLYGDEDLVISGPVPSTVTVVSPAPNATVEIKFEDNTVADGLVFTTVNTCPEGVDVSQCAWYDVQSSDGVWHNATNVYLSQDSKSLLVNIVLDSPLLSIFGVRYGYNEWPVASLYNTDGLPAPPFYSMILDTPYQFIN